MSDCQCTFEQYFILYGLNYLFHYSLTKDQKQNQFPKFIITVYIDVYGNHKNDLFFNTDDLPVRGFIGHLEEGSFLPHTHKVFLWAHLNFNIAYNGDQVMKI